jgi:murein DD-endopeptidase MepM/ murein hydrolase activator NlpD
MEWISTSDKWLSESQSLNNAQLVADHFGASWHPNSICALCGNMRHESSINPNIWEFGYGHSLSRGYGLVQWTPASKYIDWAKANGLPPYNGDSQLARMDYEIDQNIQWIADGLYRRYHTRYGTPHKYNFSFADFRSNKGNYNVSQLTEAFMWNYEGPSYSAGINSLADRQAFANKCSSLLDFSGSGGSVTTGYNFIYPTGTTNVTSGFKPPDRPDHYGVDFADGTAYDIWASADGTVTRSDVSDSYGEVVYILHNVDGQDYETVYAHMVTGSRTVSLGDVVKQGQKLGVMGSTGESTGLHLHFEMYEGRWTADHINAIDPLPLLGVDGVADTGNPNSHPKSPDQVYKEKIVSMLMTDTLNGWKW